MYFVSISKVLFLNLYFKVICQPECLDESAEEWCPCPQDDRVKAQVRRDLYWKPDAERSSGKEVRCQKERKKVRREVISQSNGFLKGRTLPDVSERDYSESLKQLALLDFNKVVRK